LPSFGEVSNLGDGIEPPESADLDGRRTACRSWYRPVRLRDVVTPRHLATIQLWTRRAKNRRVRYVWVVADFFAFRRCPLRDQAV
jgi:hypothetical protein